MWSIMTLQCNQVSVVVPDDLASILHQAICSYDVDVERLVDTGTLFDYDYLLRCTGCK